MTERSLMVSLILMLPLPAAAQPLPQALPQGLPGEAPELPGVPLGAQQPGAPMLPGGAQPGLPGGTAPGGVPMKLPKKKDIQDMSLEELMAVTLKHNADIQLAESKVREAEAALKAARATVLGRLAGMHYELESARQLVKVAEQRLDIEMRSATSSSEREKSDARLTLVRTRYELAKLEGALAALANVHASRGQAAAAALGEGMGVSTGPPPVPGKVSVLVPRPTGALSDAIRQALDVKVRLKFKEATGEAIVEWLRKQLKGVNLVAGGGFGDRTVSLELNEEVSLGAALQLLEDEFDCRCVLRDYGIVVVDVGAVPPGAPLLLDLWRQRNPAPSAPLAVPGSNVPAPKK